MSPSFFFAPDTLASCGGGGKGDKENAPPAESETRGRGPGGWHGQGEEREEMLGRAARQRRRQLERALCWEAASDPLVPGGGCM